jgi:transposase InsO family protein
MSRQNFYKSRKSRRRKRVDVSFIRARVEQQRAIQPRPGGLKLYTILRDTLLDAGIKIGRDRFLNVLRQEGLMLEPLPKQPRTTNSAHNLPVFTNLVKDMELTGPNQVWVSDITYIRTYEDFVYLCLISDKYSRKIVGYHVGYTMKTEDCLKALNMALRDLPDDANPIHHSDRGGQYCSHKYVKKLSDMGMKISMTEVNHCAENAQAERVNGILKQKYYLNSSFRDLKQAKRAVDEAVWFDVTRGDTPQVCADKH